MRAFVVAIAGVLLAAPGLAQASEDSTTSNGSQPSQTATPAANSTASTGQNDERQICRRIETNTGSRVPHRRVCMTEREWEIFNRQD